MLLNIIKYISSGLNFQLLLVILVHFGLFWYILVPFADCSYFSALDIGLFWGFLCLVPFLSVLVSFMSILILFLSILVLFGFF